MGMKNLSISPVKVISTKNFGLLTLLAFLHIVVLYPIINTPLGADDIWKSTSRSILKSQDQSLLSDSLSRITYWLEHGRLLVVSSGIEPYIYYFTSHRQLYKVALFVLICLLHLTLYQLLRTLGLSVSLAAYSILFLLCLSQMRNYFDARIHFAGAILICCLLLLSSITYLVKMTLYDIKLETYFIYLFLSILAIFSYETNIAVLFPVTTYFILQNRKRLGLIKILMISLPLAIGTIAALIIRLNAKYIEADATISLDYVSILRAFKIQLLGTVPSTNFNGIEVYHLGEETLIAVIVALAFIFSLKVLSEKELTKLSNQSNNQRRDLRCIGFSLIVFPTLLIALTPRFQAELLPGLPYVSVIFQQIGLAILVSSFLGTNKFRTNVIKVVTIFFISITVSSNYWITKTPQLFEGSAMLDNQKFGWDREIVERFFRLESISKSKQYFTFPQRAWTTSPYLSDISGRGIEILNAPDWWGGSDVEISGICTENCENEKLLTFKGWSYSSGVVSISNLTLSEFDSTKNRYLSSSGTIYLDGLTKKVTTNLNCAASKEGQFTSSISGNRVSLDFANFGKYLIIEYRTLDKRVIDPLRLAKLIKTCKLTI
jgi:hypothetical protein